VQVVAEELGTALTTVAVKDCEELYLFLGLFRVVWLETWLFQVEDNRDTIFVIVAENAIVSVGAIGNEVRGLSLLGNFCLLDNGSHRE